MEKSQLIKPDDVDNESYIFVSYSRKDMKEVQEVLKILRKNHFRFWYDMGLKSGTEWAEELGEKIDHCTQFLVILSPNAVESKYVRKEINMAIDTKSAGRILVLYLCETELTCGLQLLLNDIQAIYKNAFSDKNDFEQALCKSASREAIIYKNEAETSGEAKINLLQNYELLYKIGQGGKSSVYLARHKRTGALVAVKQGIIDDTYLGSIVLNDFKWERNVLVCGLHNSCPYVPAVLDWFQDEGCVYLVESFLEGKTLGAEAYYSEEDVVQIAKKILEILRHLHMNGIVHRDIKPNNLIKNGCGDIYLIDFCISRDLNDSSSIEMPQGTAGFAPPEQYKCGFGNEHTNYSSDIFALGKTMECLLVQDDFDRYGNVPLRYFRKDISVDLENIIRKMTDPIQDQRFQSADEVLNNLENYKTRNVLKRWYLQVCSEKRIRKYVADKKENARIRKQDLDDIISSKEPMLWSSSQTAILVDSIKCDDTTS